jgi:hypothetical protein
VGGSGGGKAQAPYPTALAVAAAAAEAARQQLQISNARYQCCSALEVRVELGLKVEVVSGAAQ